MSTATQNESKNHPGRRLSLSNLDTLRKARSKLINSLSNRRASGENGQSRGGTLDCGHGGVKLPSLPPSRSNGTEPVTDGSQDQSETSDPKDLALKHITKWKLCEQSKAEKKAGTSKTDPEPVTVLTKRRLSMALEHYKLSRDTGDISTSNVNEHSDLLPEVVSYGTPPSLPRERRCSLTSYICETGANFSKIPKNKEIAPAVLNRRKSTICLPRAHTIRGSQLHKQLSNNSLPAGETNSTVHQPIMSNPLSAYSPSSSPKLKKTTHPLNRQPSPARKQSVRVNSKLQRYLQEKKSTYSTAKKLTLLKTQFADN